MAGDQLPRNQVNRGMVIMIIAMLIVPSMDALAKLLGEDMSALQVSWGRFLFQLVVIVPILIFFGGGWPSLRTKYPVLHFMRGVLLGAATSLFFMALQHLPMADAISIFFVEPLLLTILSVIFLKETIGWRRVLAIFIGFIGAIIVIRPSFEEVGYPALLPLCTALTFSLYLMLTRKVSGEISSLAMQTYAGFSGFIFISLVIFIIWGSGLGEINLVVPTAYQWSLLFMLGVVSTVAHLMIVMAFQLAQASLLAPFQYLEIISATILGLVIFSDFPDALTWVGISIIIGSGLYIFWREQQLQKMQDDMKSR